MKLIFQLLLITLIVSCSKVYDVEKKNGVYFISDIELEFANPREVLWEVGIKREVTISKGLRISSSIPRISDHSKKILRSISGIDSWLIRLSKKSRDHLVPLDHFHINLDNISRNTRNLTINLYYHAAAVSKKFRLFHCPAFKHRSRLGDFDIEERENNTRKYLFVRPVDKFRGRARKMRFAPMVISSGRELKGIYQLDIALYNSKTKMRYGRWLPAKNGLVIERDKIISVPSCIGIKEEHRPLPQSKLPKIQDLEIR